MSVTHLFERANGPTQTQTGAEEATDHTRKIGDIFNAGTSLSCQARRGCLSSTHQRIVDVKGKAIPVCRHCASQPFEFVAEGGIRTLPNLRAHTKSAYTGSPVRSGWSGAAAGCP